jgi:hypothetical protein
MMSGTDPRAKRASSRSERSVPSVELDASLDLGDRVVHEAERLDAMPALVGVGDVELPLGGPEVLERGLHVGLVRAGAAHEESGRENTGEREGGESTTVQETVHGSSFSAFLTIGQSNG